MAPYFYGERDTMIAHELVIDMLDDRKDIARYYKQLKSYVKNRWPELPTLYEVTLMQPLKQGKTYIDGEYLGKDVIRVKVETLNGWQPGSKVTLVQDGDYITIYLDVDPKDDEYGELLNMCRKLGDSLILWD